MNAKHIEGGVELSTPVSRSRSCDSFLQVKISHWLMHGDLEMLMDILKLKALPSTCLAFTCVWQTMK